MHENVPQPEATVADSKKEKKKNTLVRMSIIR